MKRTLEKRDIAYIVDDCVRQIAGRGGRVAVAMAIGVSKRTIDAWCSIADERKPTPDKLEKMLYLSAISKLPRSTGSFNKNAICVYDSDDLLIAEFAISNKEDSGEYSESDMHKMALALYVADHNSGQVRLNKNSLTPKSSVSSSASKRHMLRVLKNSKALPDEEILEFFGVDELMLSIMMCEEAAHRMRCRAPSISYEALNHLLMVSSDIEVA